MFKICKNIVNLKNIFDQNNLLSEKYGKVKTLVVAFETVYHCKQLVTGM
jgi:hypothetical protein